MRAAVDVIQRGTSRPCWVAVALLSVACSPGDPASDGPPAPGPDGTPDAAYVSGVPALDALQLRFRPVLETNRLQFAGRTGSVHAFGPGARYPQVWLRDSATLVGLVRYTYSGEYLTSWLEEHLAHQGPSGELFDWIAPGAPDRFPYAPRAREVFQGPGVVLSADKNTSAADQETSAVLAAERVYDVLADPRWLETDVAGRPLVERLDAALGYVREERFDETRGLVESALTADWGDVSPAYPDQRAIYQDDETPVVAGLYANAMYFAACQGLARLLEVSGRGDRAARWLAEAEATRAAVQRELWLPQAGFFRMHVPVRPASGAGEKEPRFANGGNAVALLSGLVAPEQALRVIQAAEARHEGFGFAAMAGTLLPPYPAGFFKHPILTEPFTYQNGGQWDWFAGRLVLAMYRAGRAQEARRQLIALAERVERSGGVFEWHTREGEGRGSAHYAASAAALARAVYEGLYGVNLRADGLRLDVRLSDSSGSLRLHEPATGRRVFYEQQVDPAAAQVRLHWRTRPAPRGLRWLLPPDRGVAGLSVDGATRAVRVEPTGADRYLVVGALPASGTLEIRLRPEAEGPGAEGAPAPDTAAGIRTGRPQPITTPAQPAS